MAFIQAFAAPVPTANREAYLELAQAMGSFFKANGALQITECWGTELPDGVVTSFPLAVQKAEDETVVLGWITWPNQATRDAAFAAMRSDAKMMAHMGQQIFDGKRMIFGSFEPILEM